MNEFLKAGERDQVPAEVLPDAQTSAEAGVAYAKAMHEFSDNVTQLYVAYKEDFRNASDANGQRGELARDFRKTVRWLAKEADIQPDDLKWVLERTGAIRDAVFIEDYSVKTSGRSAI